MVRATIRWFLVGAIVGIPNDLEAELVTGQDAKASGELGQQAAELREAWSRTGTVTELPTRLLQQGEALRLPLLESHTDPRTSDCVTVAALGTANLVFAVTFGDASAPSSHPMWPLPSAAGVMAVTRCGAPKAQLRGLEVVLRSRRGILQFVVLSSAEPPVPLTEVLSGREPGPSRSPPDVGVRPPLAPIKERLTRLSSVARRNGGTVSEARVRSDKRGRGTHKLHLTPGCYRFAVLSPATLDAPPDIDARLVSIESATELASDVEHAEFATLRACVARSQATRLEFQGAHPQSELVIVQARWPIPDGIPVAWGSQARAGLAQELFSSGHLDVSSPPIDAAVGVRGKSRWTVSIAPHRCYVGAVTSLRGDLTRAEIRIEANQTVSSATLREGRSSSVVTFCGEGDALARVLVATTGSSHSWIAALWPLSGSP